MKALIFNNTVIQLEELTFPVAFDFTWMNAPEDCAVGWILNNGQLQPAPELQKTQEELIAMYQDSLQLYVDSKAQEKNYKNGYACATYVNSTNATWKQEATDFIAWRDMCWEYAIDIQTQVEGNQIPAPTLEDFIANAPQLIWSE